MKKFDVKDLNFRKVGRKLKTGWSKNNQAILAVVAGACAIGAVVEAIRATPKAERIKEAREIELDNLALELQEAEITTEEYQKKARKETFEAAKEYALCYAPTAALLIVSLGSTACNYKISIGKQAALLGAYKALELKSGEFVEKAKEVVGEKKVDEIKKGIVKDRIEKAKIPSSVKSPEYEQDEDGNFLAKQYMWPCWENQSGRPFMSSVSAIKIAMQKASEKCKNRGRITLNEIYEFLDPNGMYLTKNGFGEIHGFIDQDLDHNFLIPYSLGSLKSEEHDCSFTTLIFDKDPVNLRLGDDY